jgi:membrane protease YdiL (CAAX protease family)
VSVYLATFIASGFLLRAYVQWAALLSCTVATCTSIIVWDRRRFTIGFFVPARLAARELLFGLSFAMALIAAADAFVLSLSDVRHIWSGGFPLRDLAGVFVPAVLHEELAFRGYVYQKIRQWSRGLAIAISSLVFALLHSGNEGVSLLAMVNIAIAGVLLALAYERYRRLWFPIGIHFAWNVLSGPVLGFPVSGFVPRESLMRVTGSGSILVTGGPFGLEASICMTFVELAGIAVLSRAVQRARSRYP